MLRGAFSRAGGVANESVRPQSVLLRIGALALAVLLAGVRVAPSGSPANVTVGAGSVAGAARSSRNDAPPQILAMRFSSLDVRRGERWSGEFVTGTNVASIEVRTNLFSINVPHTHARALRLHARRARYAADLRARLPPARDRAQQRRERLRRGPAVSHPMTPRVTTVDGSVLTITLDRPRAQERADL